MGSLKKCRIGAVSVQGRREENQDRIARFNCPLGTLLAVADGMGGHRGGAIAASMATTRLEELLQTVHADAPAADVLTDTLGQVNQEIYLAGQENSPELAGMGSTVVAALLQNSPDDPLLLIAYAGDSRCYLYRDGKLQQLTKDHTAVQRLVDAQLISTEDARNHPNASIISRALGQGPDVNIDLCGPFVIQEMDGILLCSDGLSGFVRDQTIEELLAKSGDPQTIADQLAALALQNESDDNISAVYLQYGTEPQQHLALPDKGRGMFPMTRPQRWIAGIAAVVLLGMIVLITALSYREKKPRAQSITIMNQTSSKTGATQK